MNLYSFTIHQCRQTDADILKLLSHEHFLPTPYLPVKGKMLLFHCQQMIHSHFCPGNRSVSQDKT